MLLKSFDRLSLGGGVLIALCALNGSSGAAVATAAAGAGEPKASKGEDPA